MGLCGWNEVGWNEVGWNEVGWKEVGWKGGRVEGGGVAKKKKNKNMHGRMHGEDAWRGKEEKYLVFFARSHCLRSHKRKTPKRKQNIPQKTNFNHPTIPTRYFIKREEMMACNGVSLRGLL
jgi:hypothetical protein